MPKFKKFKNSNETFWVIFKHCAIDEKVNYIIQLRDFLLRFGCEVESKLYKERSKAHRHLKFS